MKKNILIAPLNWGLGHATRCIPIIKALEENTFTPIIASDDEQKILDGIILSVMSGKQGAVEQAAMVSIIERMKNEGAESIILGCTELPLAIDQNQSPLPVWNTISILAEKAVDESYQ